MATIALSQLLPAFTLLRSASNPVFRHNSTMLATLAAKFSPRSSQAFHQSRRPAEPNRHADVMVRLKTNGTNRLTVGMCPGALIIRFSSLIILFGPDDNRNASAFFLLDSRAAEVFMFRTIACVLLAAALGVAAEDAWSKVKALKTGQEIRVYKK